MKTARPAFSLIEVLFAVTFLIMVGLAMTALNSAAARLVSTGEVKVAGYALNNQSLAYITILRKAKGDRFEDFYSATCALGSTCYLACPQDNLNQACSLSPTPKAVQLGRSRLQYIPEIKVTKTGSSYLVFARTSWGKGVNRSVVSSQLLE